MVFMKINHVRRLSNRLTLAACLLIASYYSIKAYQQIPTDSQSQYQRWFDTNKDRLQQIIEKKSIHFHVTLHTDNAVSEWVIQNDPDTLEDTKKITRLLELAETSDIFLFTDSPTRNTSSVTLEIDGIRYSAVISRERIEATPELQTFLRLSKLYALEKQNTPARNIAHANAR